MIVWLLVVTLCLWAAGVAAQPAPPQGLILGDAYYLTVTRAGAGTGSVSGTGISCGSDCSEPYAAGAQVTLTATPSGSDVFSGWSGACSGTGTCQVTMSQARAVTATFVPGAPLTAVVNSALRFYGHGIAAPDLDRVKIQIDALPPDSGPGPAIDVGAGNFTIEFWLRPLGPNNGNCAAGATNAWIGGNIVVDRDRFNQPRSYGISLCAGRVAFGVDNAGGSQRTIVGTTDLRTATFGGQPWHHVAVTRNATTGAMAVFVNGTLEASFTGPTGDISYPDDGVPCPDCCNGGNCNFSDPFIVLGAEKHDAGSQFPSYSGLLEDLRYSNTIRYTGTFTRPSAPLLVDGNTVALYRFDEATGTTTADATGTTAHQGTLRVGGSSPAGPEWVLSSVPHNSQFFNSAECPHVNGVPVNPNHIHCDDFEDGDWYVTPDAPGSAPNDGWLGLQSSQGTPLNPPPPAVRSPGRGGSRYAAESRPRRAGAAAGGMHPYYPPCSGTSQGAETGCANGGTTYREVYMRYYFYLAPGFSAGDGQKTFSVIYPWDAFGVGYGGVHTYSYTELRASPFYDGYHDGSTGTGPRYQNPQCPGQCAPAINQNLGNNISFNITGVWYYVEHRVRLNTYCNGNNGPGGCRNGIWEVWANNCGASGVCTGTPTRRAFYDNVGWTGSATGLTMPNGLIGNIWFDIWGSTGAPPAIGGDFGDVYFDNLVVSRAFIGFAPTLDQP